MSTDPDAQGAAIAVQYTHAHMHTGPLPVQSSLVGLGYGKHRRPLLMEAGAGGSGGTCPQQGAHSLRRAAIQFG